MQKERFSREDFLAMFMEDVIRLSKYIPWLEAKSGDDVSKNYQDGDKLSHTLSFPVYDSILLAFLNDASTTVFMEQNYHYFYTKNHIDSYQDELALIEKADIMHMDILQCILSRYVFGGMVKAYLWKDGVEHRIFVNVLKKARQIVEFWSEPLRIQDEIPAEGYPVEEEFTYPEVDEEDWTDEEFAMVLSGELNPDDIPRLRYEKEHGTDLASATNPATVSDETAMTEHAESLNGEIKTVEFEQGYQFPEVDEEDWTDEEFGAVLAGELNPDDIPRLRYEKENGVKVVFVPAGEAEPETVAEETAKETEEAIEEPIEEAEPEIIAEETAKETEEVVEESVEEPVEEAESEIIAEETAKETEEVAEEPVEEPIEEAESEIIAEETAKETEEVAEEPVEEAVGEAESETIAEETAKEIEEAVEEPEKPKAKRGRKPKADAEAQNAEVSTEDKPKQKRQRQQKRSQE